MPTPYETAIGSWTRRSTFFWAATGATVGLSNLWQFPYLAGQHGGGLFILLYLACLLLVTLPLMLTESALGRQSRHGIVLAMDGFVRQGRLSRWWVWLGRLSIVSAFVVLSFTAVIGAIALAYIFHGALGRFNGADELRAAELLSGLVADRNNYRLFMGWHAFFLLLVVWISVQGVVVGLERAFRRAVPGLFVLLLGLLLYGAEYGQLGRAVDYLLVFRRENLTWDSLQAALFHAFFTLGLGMGVWVIFGAYMPNQTPLKRSVFGVVLMDTLFAIIAGLLIYALVFARAPGAGEQGFGLLFMALPLSLADLPGSQFVIAALFLMVVLVAWTTSVALLESVVGWCQEWMGSPRVATVLVMATLVWLAGLASLFSFNIWADKTVIGGTVFRWLELIVSGLLIPLVSILLALFVGWALSRPVAFGLIGRAPWLIGRIWFWVMRLVLPLVVAYIGVNYSVDSLQDLCGNDREADLCRPIHALPSRMGESERLPEAAPSDIDPQVSPPEPGAADEEPPQRGVETEEGEGGEESDKESAPAPPGQGVDKKDNQSAPEILYHSA
ncbi:sodium-dependent transporter [Marinobacter sp. SS21]|uniref:sodium-dependent transporter n=1 Tax=Marinobacter sp. SS21 TaxID=2979460 RepID=UPI0023312EF5|nr:sodium-dependent transporter [Marinobacter sp. SS21]MDC0662440.1 sodium-dependent transporter [Marinobacter sp. SS21]